jgi:3-mercaptopyruvate sulfurtransferase SseA
VALILKRNGIHRVRPLQGGLDLWRGRNFPVEAMSRERQTRETAA